MYKRVMLTFFLLPLFVLIFMPGTSIAFKKETRCQILKDSIHLSPKKLRAYLVKNFDAVHDAIHFADRNRQAHLSINPENTIDIYTELVKSVQNGQENEYNTARRFGILACFIAETISPDNFNISRRFIPDRVTYNGFQKVNNVEENVSGLVTKYRKPYKGNKQAKVTDHLYNVAVNEIIDQWISVWKAGGKDPGPHRPEGAKVSHKNRVIRYNYMPT
jgi:hypothetical protein